MGKQQTNIFLSRKEKSKQTFCDKLYVVVQF